MESQETKIRLLPTFRRFLAVNTSHRRLLLLCGALTIAQALALSLRSVYFGRIFDAAADAPGSLLTTILIAVALQAVAIPLQYWVGLAGGKYSSACSRTMREYTFSRIAHGDMQALERHRMGDLVSRVNGDLDEFNNDMGGIIYWDVPQFLMMAVALVVCLVINWKLSLISFTVIPLLGFLQSRTGMPIAKYSQARNEAEGRAASIAVNFLGGHAIAKVFNLYDEMKARYTAAVEDAVEANRKAFRMEFILLPLQFLMMFLPYILIITVGMFLVMGDGLTAGQLISFIFLSSFVLEPIGGMSWVIRGLYRAAGNAVRVFEAWDMKQEREGGAAMDIQDAATPVSMEHIAFSYENKQQVLHDVSLEVQAGQRVALVGASGSGKSTLMKLINAFYAPSGGTLTLFGREIEAWNTAGLRGHIAFVDQSAFLFPGSIYTNVALGREGATEAEIAAVLEQARLSHLDVHAPLGERGAQLSGGERQRVAIARAMLKNAPLLLLDEPTSALDVESEYHVAQALEALMRGRTTIIIAHRLSALRDIGRIFCLEGGRIAEAGTHAELLAKGGVYRRLYEAQIKEEVENHEA